MLKWRLSVISGQSCAGCVRKRLLYIEYIIVVGHPSSEGTLGLIFRMLAALLSRKFSTCPKWPEYWFSGKVADYPLELLMMGDQIGIKLFSVGSVKKSKSIVFLGQSLVWKVQMCVFLFSVQVAIGCLVSHILSEKRGNYQINLVWLDSGHKLSNLGGILCQFL